MTTDHDVDLTVLGCGESVERLSEYLDADRTPYDARIETCPECLNAIEALARVGRLSRNLVEDDAARLPAPSDAWFQSVMTAVRAELTSGRSLPLSHPDPRVRLSVTEGAVRALLRAAGDGIDGVYVGRTEIVGDAETPAAPVQVNLTATVAWGRALVDVASTLRGAAREALARHTELNVTAVNVRIDDVYGFYSAKGTP